MFDVAEIPTPSAAFFDVDKTVIAKAAMVAFARPLYDAGFINRRLLAQAAYNNLRFRGFRGPDAKRMAELREMGLRTIKGWNASEVRDIVKRTLPERIEPAIFPAALTAIRCHQRDGQDVYLVSAEPEEIVAPLAEHIGVYHVICSQATVGADGCYTGESRSWIYGPAKATAIREAARRHNIDLQGSFAYSDSATDEPMLATVGHPVAVNPDRALERIAAARGWEVQRFCLERKRSALSDRRLAWSR